MGQRCLSRRSGTAMIRIQARPLYTQFVLRLILRDSRFKGLLVFCCVMLALAPAILAAGRFPRGSPLADSTQAIVVTTPNWAAVDGTLQRYERTARGDRWRPVGNPVPVVVGRSGLAWGAGGPPIAVRGSGDPVKREGDLRAPAGIFHLGAAFGYAPAEPVGWSIPYLPLTPAIECVDDPHSKFYNRVVDRTKLTPDWNSSEHMRSAGEYYRWGLVVDQNPGAQPGAGSCVFMHIWSDGGAHGTEGCTAMAGPQVEALLAWLKPEADPLLIQMPTRQYREVKKRLHLP